MTDTPIPAADAAQLPATLPGSPPADPPSPDAGAQPAAGIPSEDASPAHGYDLAGINVAEADRPAVEEWGAVFQRNEVSPTTARTVIGYVLGDLRGEQERPEPVAAHGYNVRDFNFSERDRPNLTRVLNKLASVGATEQEVFALLRSYRDAAQQAQKSRARGPIQRQDWNQPAQRSSGAGDQAELAKIEAFMRSNRAAYFKDEAMQARYRQLLAAGGR